MNDPQTIDYLVIGHITRDLTPAGPVVGGTAAYASRTARALGYKTAVLTSAGPDFDLKAALPHIAVANVPAAATTTFENVYTPRGRVQHLYGVAAPLTAADVPAAWRDTPIVHLAPLVQEVDPALVDQFPGCIVGLTPQGWLRTWDETGLVRATEWVTAQEVLSRATAVFLSVEDLPDIALLAQYRRWAPLLVLTQGPLGCTVFRQDEGRQVPVTAVAEVNPTGAGDIFAAAFLIRLHESGDPIRAAEFANEVAAQSVTREALADKVTAWITQQELE